MAVLTFESAGKGHSLFKFDTAMLASLRFNPFISFQAKDRVCRINNKNEKIRIYQCVSPDPQDSKVLHKFFLPKLAVGYILTDGVELNLKKTKKYIQHSRWDSDKKVQVGQNNSFLKELLENDAYYKIVDWTYIMHEFLTKI